MEADKKIRVCHLASGDLWAGAEAQLTILMGALAKYEDLELSAILYNYGMLEEKLKALGIPVYVIPETKNNSLKLAFQTAKILKREKIFILHTHRYKENVLGGLASRFSGIKHVVRTMHGLPEPLGLYKKMKSQFYNFLDFSISRLWVDKIIAVSNDIKNSLRTRIDETRIVAIHNGIDVENTSPNSGQSNLREMLQIDQSDCILGACGRLTPVKGYEFLLQAYQIISTRRSNTMLILAGDGPERNKLEKLARKLKISDTVIFIGFIPDVRELLGILDIFVLSSLHEGIPISLLDAMALGVAVVATNVGGIPEVIAHGQVGLLVPPKNPQKLAEACLSLIMQKQARERMAARAKESVARHFSKEVMGEKVKKLYDQLVRG